MKRMKKAGLVASSMAAIAVCSSLIVGSTYALFTSEDNVDIAITAGTVSVSAEIVESSLELTSMGVTQDGNNWANGGSAGFSDEKHLDLTYITPGDSATFDIKVTNASNVNIQYRLNWSVDGELADVLVADAIGAEIGNWTEWLASDEVKEKTVTVTVSLPEEVDNLYQNKSASISFAVEAVQGNASPNLSAFEIENSENEDGPLVMITGVKEGVTDIVIPAESNGKPVWLAADAFKGNEELETVTINCKQINSWAFQGCENLKTVILGEGVETIGQNAFSGTFGRYDEVVASNKIETIHIPASVKYIGTEAFRGCENLKTVTFAENSQLISIGADAFLDCINLAPIEYPNSVV